SSRKAEQPRAAKKPNNQEQPKSRTTVLWPSGCSLLFGYLAAKGGSAVWLFAFLPHSAIRLLRLR
ncbi:MAG: hypothetical protein ABJB74_07220, partial [Gemmatimonas sp.]